MKNIINYFLKNSLVTNIIFFGVLLVGILTWSRIGKEEMPEFSMDWINTTINYPGASAKQVEKFIIRPIEDELKSVQGIFAINSNASPNSASISVSLDSKNFNQKKIVQDFKDAVLRVSLPSGVRKLPRFRQYRSSEKAIIDVGIYFDEYHIINDSQRTILQNNALLLESKLLNSKKISSITKKGYLKPEIIISPNKLVLDDKDITVSSIIEAVSKQHMDSPIGQLREDIEQKFTLSNALDSPSKIKKVPIRANYSGSILILDELAQVQKKYINTPSIFKINGRQGIVLNVKKSPSSDILSAREVVLKEIKQIKDLLKEEGIQITLMDDESTDVRNRLKLILSNGATGFLLIILILLVALNFKTAFWVSMGIPFSLAFTMIIAHLLDQTINNMTLAGIIIVLGIVVDDAIIVADNIKEKYERGLKGINALQQGVIEVITPITISILTTILAFIPLMFFGGYFGLFIRYIPLIVFLMLMGSLLESYFILPNHLKLPTSEEGKIKRKKIFLDVEKKYRAWMSVILRRRYLVLGASILSLVSLSTYFIKKSKFMMFPKEDVKEVFIKVITKQDSDRIETANAVRDLELLIKKHPDTVAVRTNIASSRRGREVKQNQAWLRIEVKNKLDREGDLKQMIKTWEAYLQEKKNLNDFTEARLFKSWFGHGSGSPIEVMVRSGNDQERLDAAKMVAQELEKISDIKNTDVEKPIEKKEFQININHRRAKELGVNPKVIESTIRAATFGEYLYSLRDDYQEFETRLKIEVSPTTAAKEILNLKVPASNNNNIALSKIITFNEVKSKSSIYRHDYQRTTRVFADFKVNSETTPLELGQILEDNIFPKINKTYKTVSFLLKGEIEDSRKGISDFRRSILMVIFGILVILIIGFNDLKSPLIIVALIPFGLGSACLTLLAHGQYTYGFFSVIGGIGMIGVMVNDAIVMVDKINRSQNRNMNDILVASSSRIRAVSMTTVTTVAGILPTAYGLFGYDSMLGEMMLVMGWGLLLSTLITLILVPILYSIISPGKRI